MLGIKLSILATRPLQTVDALRVSSPIGFRYATPAQTELIVFISNRSGAPER